MLEQHIQQKTGVSKGSGTFPVFAYSGKGAKKEIKISVLQNSVYYFLQHVFIITAKDDSRLVVIHNNRLLTDNHYKTLKGARIAFQKKYKHKPWKNGVKARWSYFRQGECSLCN